MQVAALVPDITCCVLIGKKTFSTSPNSLAFIWDICSHLTTCLNLTEPHYPAPLCRICKNPKKSFGTHLSKLRSVHASVLGSLPVLTIGINKLVKMNCCSFMNWDIKLQPLHCNCNCQPVQGEELRKWINQLDPLLVRS